MSKVAGNDYYDDTSSTKVDLFTKVELHPLEQCLGMTVRICESLRDTNYAVIDDLLPEADALALRDEVAKLYADGHMSDGAIGSGTDGSTGTVRHTMRTDKMVWMEGSESFVGPQMRKHITRMDIITQKIAIFFRGVAKEHTWAGPHRTKAMATVYAGTGARYVPHYDNPNGNGRKLTTLLYLNEGWKPQHGGVMRLKTNKTVVSIAPLLNRLVFFWSDRRVPHEVLPATGPDRYAVTIWYLDDNERGEGQERSTPA
jgi:hypoxia-inducible factor (prolyl hydroxylase)